MTNEFYQPFDTEAHGRRLADDRTPFQQDRDRIIYTSAFRRLQAKTQVFSVGEYDFYRTRLTHSIEVAQIGRSICHALRVRDPLLGDRFFVDPDLVEAVCLAHDLGHPPFGHAGERELHARMKPFGGFEGNAQTLRLLTETIFSRQGKRTGLRPTRAFVDGVLKYKTRFSELPDPLQHFLYDDQAEHVEFVFDGRSPTPHLTPGPHRNAFRSVECQIMDWADDTAYSLNDVNDSIRAGFLNARRVERWAESQELDAAGADAVTTVLDTLRDGDVDRSISRQIGEFIRACTLRERANFMSDRTHRYRLELAVEPEVRRRADWYRRLVRDVVFRSAPLQQLEFKGRRLLERLFAAYQEAYHDPDADSRRLALLPEERDQAIRAEPDPARRARLWCDYLAGMTDGFAVRTYKRLFDPEFGSMVDLV